MGRKAGGTKRKDAHTHRDTVKQVQRRTDTQAYKRTDTQTHKSTFNLEKLPKALAHPEI